MPNKVLLLDSNILVDYYLQERSSIVQSMKALKKARQEGRCRLFIPNFCIAEVFSTFARKCYLNNDLNEAQSRRAKWAFVDEISRDYEYARYQFFTHIELNRYHLFNGHMVYTPAWEFVSSLHHEGRFEGKYPSTFDLLVIAQGIEMTSLYSEDNFRLVTSDALMLEICNYLQKIEKDQKLSYITKQKKEGSAYKYLDEFKYPKVLYAVKPALVDKFLS